ncbi:glutamine--tRNA ligase/YqeY domain fusion protein [Salinispira pacifica]|nr:glutamine--tRNA ligase/YqeY domain fusion protein [Salinispira pacifica]
MDTANPREENASKNDFIRSAIREDMKEGRFPPPVHTRFPPEPNGYLHIGHAKSICLNYGLADDFEGAVYNLRFDDTNPVKEEQEYVDSIMEDIRWLGFDWEDRLYFASDYFQQLYDWAVKLIRDGNAYVDSQDPETISKSRGTPTEPGVNSPYRDRSVEENLKLFEEMRQGKHPDGSSVLRAKIDMAHPNLNMRDPVMYRIKHARHHRTGDDWCIYPMYDWAHGQSDALENITHSLCTLEFENHRPLYNWFLEKIGVENPPRQIEFARLNLTYTVMSKRKLRQLVEDGHVESWDDPRMPTVSGMRRRGYTPEAIRKFAAEIGVTKTESMVDLALLEFFVREHLNKTAQRRMAVLDPVKMVITNYPEGKEEWLEADNNPEDEHAGTRSIPFSGELYIERDDFMEDPPKKFFRLAPGKEVRLKHAYFVTCDEVIKDASGNITELRCSYDPESRGGQSPDGRKVKGTLHWVSAAHALDAEVRLYDNLFLRENLNTLEEDEDSLDYLNPESLVTVQAKLEPSLGDAEAGSSFQFLRKGYFCADSKDHKRDHSGNSIVFNRTVQLKDSWAKVKKKG